jgi:hypothetical protein
VLALAACDSAGQGDAPPHCLANGTPTSVMFKVAGNCGPSGAVLMTVQGCTIHVDNGAAVELPERGDFGVSSGATLLTGHWQLGGSVFDDGGLVKRTCSADRADDAGVVPLGCTTSYCGSIDSCGTEPQACTLVQCSATLSAN